MEELFESGSSCSPYEKTEKKSEIQHTGGFVAFALPLDFFLGGLSALRRREFSGMVLVGRESAS